MKTGQTIFIALLFLVIGILISVWYVKANGAYYKLPREGSTDVWGPWYWRAIHSIANRIPCSICREDGKSMFVFAHDIVNKKTDKPLWDEKNFFLWVDKISQMKKYGSE